MAIAGVPITGASSAKSFATASAHNRSSVDVAAVVGSPPEPQRAILPSMARIRREQFGAEVLRVVVGVAKIPGGILVSWAYL